ncbi:MAG TPA: hypothetical protein EYP10_14560, partial [Armatimonadetes bacterium]|nr:hypothetical protein [Armatimonadota bacterium]
RKQVIPASALSSDGKRGLRGEYFTNIELKGKPAMVRYDEAIAFRWEAGSPFEKLKMPAIEVTWRWANLGSGRIIGIVDVSRGALLRVSGYQPWKFEPSYLVVDKKELQGKVRGALDEDIKAVLAFIGNASPERCGDDYLIYRVAPDRPLAFAIAFKASRKELPERLEIEAPTVERVKKRLDALANEYTARKAREGVSYEAVGNALRWMTSYRPGSLKRYLPVGRRWVWGDITVLGFETFLSAIAVAPVDTDLAYDTLLALFSVQGENGIIPHRAIAPGKGTYDRSAPPIGSFCIWQIYRITKDKDLLRVTYPRLKRWHEWWLQRVETGKPRRDGNEDGLLEWGSDGGSLQSALAESSMHDSPLWDGVIFNWNTWTMECNAVDLNSLYALDALYLAKIATELGIYTHSNTFMREYERIRRLMNEAMWDERLGIYVDVRWDGRKSERIGASNFYPLLAGIPTKKRAERMRAVLRDDDKFWGKWMLPTISRDDRVFYQQRFWRGAITPATNYLVYHALLEAGFVDEARALAKSSMELFLRDWNDGCRLRESWLATTGEGVGDDYYTLGALMALIGTGWQ